MSGFQYYEIRPCVNRLGQIESFLGGSDENGNPTPEGSLEAAQLSGLPVFWTLYGHTDDGMEAIGDFKSFDAAYETMENILQPLIEAMDWLSEANTGTSLRAMLEDIILQSTTRDRI
jgi:hypothetical protein